MTESIVEFVTARLDDRQRLAEAACAGPWTVDDTSYAEYITGADGTQVVSGGRWGGAASIFDSTADALHIAANDPAFVLADIAAKRKVIELHYARRYGPTADLACAACGTWYEYPEASPCATVKALAEPFSGHPDYRQEWRLTDG